MATTYTWDIQNVDLLPSHNGNENVVCTVVWECTATTDEGKTKKQLGVIELDINSNAADFVPIAEVTKEQIIGWVKEKVAVKVIEDSLFPAVTTISFSDAANTVTVAERLAASIADAENPTPTPTPPTE